MRERDLTPRQMEVLRLAARGYEIKESAREMGVTPDTIKQHRGTLMLKLRAHTITHAVAVGFRDGLLTRADLW